MADMNKTRYTHRDYESLKADLISAIPSLTQEWTSREDADPGIVLIKLMSMFGDNLSYNIDKTALEMYLSTVTQRKNCAKILELLGYKMHWYRSGKVVVHCSLIEGTDSQNNPKVCVLSPFVTRFRAGEIYYTVIPQSYGEGDIEINSTDTNVPVQTVEGIVQEVKFNAVDLVNNRYYFAETNIDEAHIWLTYGERHTCVQVENLYSETSSTNATFTFNVDEYDNPYIELVDSWADIVGANTNTMSSAQFTMRYIISHGAEGNITDNAFTSVSGSSDNSNLKFYNVTNSSVDIYEETNYNTQGHNPQEVDEAKADAKKYVFTHDTLVSPSDFEKAAKRVENITATKIVDRLTMIQEGLDENDILNRARDAFGNKIISITYTPRERNLLPYLYADGLTKTSNGITYTVDKMTGQIQASGLCTGTSEFVLYDRTVQPLFKLDSTDDYLYTFSGFWLGTGYNIIVEYYDVHTGSPVTTVKVPASVTGTPVRSTPVHITADTTGLTNPDIILSKVSIQISQLGDNVNNLYLPQMELGGTATDYERLNPTEHIDEDILPPYRGILYVGYQDFDIDHNSYHGTTDIYTVDDYNTPTQADLGYYPYKISSYIQLAINSIIQNSEIMNTSVEYGTVKLYPFKVSGTLYLTEPMNPIDCETLIKQINTNLKAFFYPDKHEFGEKPSFLDIVDVIQNTSTKVKYFDALNNIIVYNTGVDLDTFDDTSFVIYDGLHSTFNLDKKFLKFKLRSLETEENIDLVNLSIERGYDPTDPGTLDKLIYIAPQQTIEVALENLTELDALCKDIQSTSYIVSVL